MHLFFRLDEKIRGHIYTWFHEILGKPSNFPIVRKIQSLIWKLVLFRFRNFSIRRTRVYESDWSAPNNLTTNCSLGDASIDVGRIRPSQKYPWIIYPLRSKTDFKKIFSAHYPAAFRLNEQFKRLLIRGYAARNPFYDPSHSLLTVASNKLQSVPQSTLISRQSVDRTAGGRKSPR